MNDSFSPDMALGFIYAGAIGFLVGRTREQDEDPTPKPGLRDFVILSTLGAMCGLFDIVGVTITMTVSAAAMLIVMRVQYSQRTGITTELSALMTFLLGYLCLTENRVVGISLGIILAVLLSTKEQVHRFALKTISGREYADTLKFLALIFVIFPLLPSGRFGPFEFFEPRKIWFFVILVAAVSYVGYFLTKFLDPRKGMTISAIVGGLASTTAYTSGASRLVAESPGSALPIAGAALLANSIQYPRLLLLIFAASPGLAQEAMLPLLAMFTAGLISAAVLVRTRTDSAPANAAAGFKNPLTLGPALKFGLVFTAILFITRGARHFFGQSGQMISSSIGGLIDTDAVLLSLTDFFSKGQTTASDAVFGIILAAAGNAVLKSIMAYMSGQPAFYVRLIIGFVVISATGLAVFFLA